MQYNEQSIFTFVHHGDVYEVRLHGCTISSITRYMDGSSLRQEIEYADLSVDVQDRILDKVHEMYLNS